MLIKVKGYNWITNKHEVREIEAKTFHEVDIICKQEKDLTEGKTHFEPLRLDTLVSYLGEWANVHELELMNSQYVYFATFAIVILDIKRIVKNNILEHHDRRYQIKI